jgi:hypothetical protein
MTQRHRLTGRSVYQPGTGALMNLGDPSCTTQRDRRPRGGRDEDFTAPAHGHRDRAAGGDSARAGDGVAPDRPATGQRRRPRRTAALRRVGDRRRSGAPDLGPAGQRHRPQVRRADPGLRQFPLNTAIWTYTDAQGYYSLDPGPGIYRIYVVEGIFNRINGPDLPFSTPPAIVWDFALQEWV